jgi:hypothetical protein
MADNDRGSVPARLYEDAAAPTVQAIGATLGGVVRALLAPINFHIWSAEQAVEYAKEELVTRLERMKVPPDKLLPPPIETAGPVIQSLRFPDQDPTLRDMFLTLLASSMDGRYPSRSHPAFVDVVRQLSPLEARLIAVLASMIRDRTIPLVAARGFPLLSVRRVTDLSIFETLLKHVSLLGSHLLPPVDVPRQAIDNLDRLGIIAVHEDQGLRGNEVEAQYDELHQHPQVLQAISASEDMGGTISYNNYLAEITDFGLEFCAAVTESDVE